MTGFLTLFAVFLVLFVVYEATMYFWTIRLFRAYAYLHLFEHSKSRGRQVDEEVVKAAKNFAKAQGYQKEVLLEAALPTKVIQVNAEVKRWSLRYSRQHT